MTMIKTANNKAESAVSDEAQDSPQSEPSYSAPAVDRALDIIEHLAVDSRGRGINELARELGIPVNSAYRVLQRLVDRGYVRVDDDGHQLTSRIYSLGLSLQARFDLKGRARPHLETLSHRTRLTCTLQIIESGKVLIVDSVVPETDFWLAVRDGIRLEVTSSAFGKAILPFLSKPEQKAILSKARVKHTPNTLMTEAALRSAMAETEKNGIGWDRQECVIGIFCVAAPVFDARGAVVGAVGGTGFAADGMDNGRLARPVLEAAAATSADIGYAGSRFEEWRQCWPTHN